MSELGPGNLPPHSYAKLSQAVPVAVQRGLHGDIFESFQTHEDREPHALPQSPRLHTLVEETLAWLKFKPSSWQPRFAPMARTKKAENGGMAKLGGNQQKASETADDAYDFESDDEYVPGAQGGSWHISEGYPRQRQGEQCELVIF